MKIKIGICFILYIYLLTGCASSPSLSQIPRQVIDRKPVLPEGVSTWKPLMGLGWGEENRSFIYPFLWEQGYSPYFTLIWMPLPLQFRALLYEKEGLYWLTLEAAFLGSLESRDRDFDWRPEVQLLNQYRIHPQIALRSEALFQSEIRRGSENIFSYTTGMTIGTLWQTTSFLSVNLEVGFLYEQGLTRARYIGYYNTDETNPPRVRYPVFFDFRAVFTSQWEVSLKGEIDYFGYSGVERGGSAYFSVAYSW